MRLVLRLVMSGHEPFQGFFSMLQLTAVQFDKSLAINGDYTEAKKKLALTCYKRGDLTRAESLIKEALELSLSCQIVNSIFNSNLHVCFHFFESLNREL